MWQIIRMIVKQEHWAALARWVESAKPDERMGLKMIQSIIKYQGTKRFRTKNVDKNETDLYLAEAIEYMCSHDIA